MLLAFSMTASMMLIPSANAHTPPWKITTYCYVEAEPNPVGVGQTVYIDVWIDEAPPFAVGNYGDRWTGMTVTVTTPSGGTVTLGPLTSTPTGGASTTYVPTVAGNYTFVGYFPTQIAENTNPYPYYTKAFPLQYPLAANDSYLTSTSAPATLTVQTTSIPSTQYPANPLPTEFWTNPVTSMNRNWYVINGNWYSTTLSGDASNQGNFNPYTQAPSTAHILWTRPQAFGGQIGGSFGSDSLAVYATGTAYEGKFGYRGNSPVILNGYLYYTFFPGASNNPDGFDCVDLKTGQILWNMPFVTNGQTDPNQQELTCGMTLNFYSQNQYGAHAYLFSETQAIGSLGSTKPIPPETNCWDMYDAMTGQWILTISNATPGTLVNGPNGEILSYTASNGKLNVWNSTACIITGENQFETFTSYSAEETWHPPQGATLNWPGGAQSSWPVATSYDGTPITLGISKVDYADGVVLMTYNSPYYAVPSYSGWTIFAGYSATNGTLLWGPYNETYAAWSSQDITAMANGVIVEENQQTQTWSGWNEYTGKLLWSATPWTNAYDYFERGAVIGYGNVYCCAFGGQVACYNLETGAEVWNWSTGSSGYDTPYGVYPIYDPTGVLAGGFYYVGSSHEYTPPFYEGARVYCLNATTGQEVWSILDFTGSKCDWPTGDGVLVTPNTYTMELYAFGQGPSKTTVTAPDVGVTTATPVTITGTVTDISAGSQETAVAANFPNGLPCVSDASMSQFMDAVYQQQPMPTNLTGVPVTVAVTDKNGNCYVIGTTRTDPYTGFFSLNWTPIITGNFTVTATFAGSGGYYGSSATTAFYASSPSATAAPAASPPTGLASTGTVMLGVAVIVIVIVIIGVAIMLMLRKRP